MPRVQAVKGKKNPVIKTSNLYEIIPEKGYTLKDYSTSKWQLFQLSESGKWELYSASQIRINQSQTQYIFSETHSLKVFLVTAYQNSPILNETPALQIIPNQGEKKIINAFIIDKKELVINKNNFFSDSVYVKIYAVNLQEKINIKIIQTISKEVSTLISWDGIVLNSNEVCFKTSFKTISKVFLNANYKIVIENSITKKVIYEKKIIQNNSDINIDSNIIKDTLEKPINNKCLCSSNIDKNILIKLGINPIFAEKFAIPIQNVLDKYLIKSCLQKAHFLAQVFYESGYLKYQQEIWGPTEAQKKYEGRTDLGNIQKGDGEKFMGRGLIQLTGRYNYQKYSEFSNIDFIYNPKKLAEIPYCIDSAAWFWVKYLAKNLNDIATENDIFYITYLINGGFNGFFDSTNKGRKSLFQNIFNVLACKNETISYDFSIQKSKCWNIHDAVYQYANLSAVNSVDARIAFKRYIELGNVYLVSSNITQDRKSKIENRLKIASEKV